MHVFLNWLSKTFAGLCESIVVDHRDLNQPQVTLCVFNQQSLLVLLYFLKLNSRVLLNCLIDVTSVDWLGSELNRIIGLVSLNNNRFQLTYSLLSLYHNFRVRLAFFVNDWDSVLSISFLFRAAAWFEREVWDMFGIYFDNHADLRRILTDYGFNGFPLRKDFPLSGYEEIRYNEVLKGVFYEVLELTQEMRNSELINPWIRYRNLALILN